MYLKTSHLHPPLWLVLCALIAGGWHGGVYGGSGDTAGAGPVKPREAPAMTGRLIVKFRTPVAAGKTGAAGTTTAGLPSFDRVAQQLQPTGLHPLFPAMDQQAGKLGPAARTRLQAMQHIFEFRYAADLPPHLAAAVLADDPNVVYAEPRYRYPLTGFIEDAPSPATKRHQLEPNDPQFAEMEHLAFVRLPSAWDIVKSSDGDVVVAIVDAGIDWRHEDLVTNIWQNRAELHDNGVDDDGNGFVDDVRGWNFANDTNDPTGLPETVNNGIHGTLVAGVASAVTDNQSGIAGASWNARLMPVNVGCPATDNAVCFGYEGILYAASQGADIINVSWGGPDSNLGRDVITTVHDLGVLVVASAGNGNGVEPEGINIDEAPSYPSAYDRVLVVGSTQKANNQKADFSNYGVGVDVFAPGVQLNSTLPNNSYSTLASGTSFSTPIVTGLAALLKTHHPTWSLDQIREQIRASAEPMDAENDPALTGLLGKGRINALVAIANTTLPAVSVRDYEMLNRSRKGLIKNGEPVSVTVNLVNHRAAINNLILTLSIDDPAILIDTESFILPGLATGEEAEITFTFSFLSDVPKDKTLRFRMDVEGGDGYKDAALIKLVANRATHDTGVLQMSITEEGNIGWAGFQENSEGQGFRYLGVDWLFEGGLLVATGEDKISDSIRNTGEDTQENDLRRPEDGFFGILESPVVDEAGLVVLDDASADRPIGIKIQQESYADTRAGYNDFIILRYVISHADEDATAPITNLHVGLFTDWDITLSGSADYARYDGDRRMGIVQPSEDDPVILFATRLLDQQVSYAFRAIDNEEIFDSRSGGDGFTDEEKWLMLSRGVQVTEVDDTDVSTLLAAGPMTFVPGERIEVAFALMAARSSEELAAIADRAQNFWDGTLRQLSPYPVTVEDETPAGAFDLDAPFPNPAATSMSIGFSLPAPAAVQLVLYDALGRQVDVLLDEVRAPGRHRIQWDGRNQNGEIVSNGVYFYRMKAVSDQGNFDATRRFVFVR